LSGFEKMESGINGRAIDFVKLGSLYLHRGQWRGKQVIPADWVDQSTRYTTQTDPALKYQYGWWTFHKEGLGDYYAAIGNKGQYVFVFPQQRLVILRQGIERGSVDWPKAIAEIALAQSGRLGQH
jgi:CubicO group peptidase (beta-lactamase class C family)